MKHTYYVNTKLGSKISLDTPDEGMSDEDFEEFCHGLRQFVPKPTRYRSAQMASYEENWIVRDTKNCDRTMAGFYGEGAGVNAEEFAQKMNDSDLGH